MSTEISDRQAAGGQQALTVSLPAFQASIRKNGIGSTHSLSFTMRAG